MNIPQMMLFGFISGWVIGDICQASYHDKIYAALILMFTIGYLNTSGRFLIDKIKRIFKL